jgi:hypothetical protein
MHYFSIFPFFFPGGRVGEELFVALLPTKEAGEEDPGAVYSE